MYDIEERVVILENKVRLINESYRNFIRYTTYHMVITALLGSFIYDDETGQNDFFNHIFEQIVVLSYIMYVFFIMTLEDNI